MKLKFLKKCSYYLSAAVLLYSGFAQSSLETEIEQVAKLSGMSLLIGTYTEFHNETIKSSAPFASKGIYGAYFDMLAPSISAPQLIAETPNPSFGALSQDKQFFYTV